MPTSPCVRSAAVTSTAVFGGYDRWSATYDRDDNPMVAMAERALTRSLGQLAGRRVLELGCGTGRNAQAFLDAGVAEYVGVDGSRGMLELARQRGLDARVSWIQGDLLDDLPELGRFDLVLFCLVLEHIEYPELAFRRVAARLAPGGALKAYEIHPELRADGTQAHFKVGGREVLLASFLHTSNDLSESLAAAGLPTVTFTDWYATPDTLLSSSKLAKHLGRPVLLEISARR